MYYVAIIIYVTFTALQSFGFLSPGIIPQFTHNEDYSTTIVNQQPVPVSVTTSNESIGTSRKRPISSDESAGQKYLKKSSVDAEFLTTSAEQLAGQKSFKPSSVYAEFLDMKMQLQRMLQASSSQIAYEQCQSLMASHEHDIALFSTEYLSYLKERSDISEILQSLSPFFNWLDHSVLHEVVKACNNPDATLLLQKFDSQVDLSLPITEYPVPQPIPSMAPYDTSTQTMLAIKLNAELSKFSLQQVIELRCLIQKTFHITEHGFQFVAAKRSSTILYWMVPKCVSHLISPKIFHETSLHDGRVQEVCIYPGTLFVSSTYTLKLGSLSFLNQMVR